MRQFCLLVLVGVMMAGCGSPKGKPVRTDTGGIPGAPTAKPGKGKVTMVPDLTVTGNIVRLNASGRFVVVNFPVAKLPKEGQALDVIRQGAKVGELKVSTWQQGDNTVADIVSGDAQVGDEVRSR